MRGIETSLRILIVDDNVDAAESLALLLQSWGQEVCLAHDGPAAIEAAREFQPQAILLDIGLPRLNGWEVARHLRSLPDFRHTFIAALSGYNGASNRRRAVEAGMDLYLVKPFDPEDLEEILLSRLAPAEAVLGRC